MNTYKVIEGVYGSIAEAMTYMLPGEVLDSCSLHGLHIVNTNGYPDCLCV